MNALMFLNLDTPIHRLNPLAKLFIVACLWAASFASSNLVVMLVVVAYCLILWRLARIPLSGMKIFLGTVAFIGFLMVVIQQRDGSVLRVWVSVHGRRRDLWIYDGDQGVVGGDRYSHPDDDDAGFAPHGGAGRVEAALQIHLCVWHGDAADAVGAGGV